MEVENTRNFKAGWTTKDCRPIWAFRANIFYSYHLVFALLNILDTAITETGNRFSMQNLDLMKSEMHIAFSLNLNIF